MLSLGYRILTSISGPALHIYLRRRRSMGREDAVRFKERFGVPSAARPDGRLIWCHAASMGEATSLLALIDEFMRRYPDDHILMTSGTVSSAAMLKERLPAHVIHQYIPVDRMGYVRRFLDHWRPDFAIWVESELWPNTLAALRDRKIPAVLLNATMSEKSFKSWYRLKGWARQILESFVFCAAQSEEDQSRFVALGAKPVRCLGNLKYAALPLSVDEAELERLRLSIGDRPNWVLASSHEGEEAFAIETHKSLLGQRPGLLTLIVPRHPHRAEAIADLIRASGLTVAQRSKGEAVTAETQIYLADTMGELGLFYRLSRIMCMGGSFVPIGGHNLVEPAQLGCAIIFGPHMTSHITPEFVAGHAAIQLQNANELSFTVNRLMAAPAERDRLATAAKILASEKRHVLDRIMEALKPWLGSAAVVGEKVST